MRWSRRVVLGAGVSLLVAGLSIHADTLVMSDGRRLVGEVTQTADGFTIKLKAGLLSVTAGEVTKWEKDPAAPTSTHTPTPAPAALPQPTPARTITPEDQKRALVRMQQLIHQGLMAIAADDNRAALDNFIDARALGDRARIRMDAADQDVFALFEGLAVCYMQKGRFELATEPMERAYSSPLRGRSALVNRVVLSLVQHSSPARAIKDIQSYLAAHPEPDEMLLNLMGSSLYVATKENALSRSDIYRLGSEFYENKVKQLEKTRPGQRRWGMQWLPEGDFILKYDDLQLAKSKFDAAAKSRDSAYAALQEAQGDFESKQGAIKYTKSGSSARSQAVSDANDASRAVSRRNGTYEKKLAGANEAYKAIVWPEWSTKFPPVLPDAALPYTRPTMASVAVATPRPTAPAASSTDIGTAIRPRIVNEPVKPSGSAETPSAPPPVIATTPPAPERRMITRQAVAIPVGSDLLLTSGLLVDTGSSIQLENSSGDQFKAEFVRKDPATGLALLRAPGQRLRYLNLADRFTGGEVQCWGYPEVSIFNVASQNIGGSAAAPKIGWSVSLQKHPRLTGAAIVDKAGKLVGVALCERDTASSQIPTVPADAVRAFLGADLPTTLCANPDPAGVFQMTASRAAN